jgi:hypothetical protein
MKQHCLIIALTIAVSSPVIARDTQHMFPIKDAINTPAAKEKLNQSVKFYFGGQKHPKAAKSFGEFTSNKKTNAFNKSDQEACEWAFLSTLISLQDRALKEGGDAVINIKSYYKKNETSSATAYECHAGAMVSGVAFKGEVVKLKK